MPAIRQTALPGVVAIMPDRHGDHRGFFSETFSARLMAEHGLPQSFCQDNHSLSRETGVIRGLHYQLPPFAQDKLVRVVRGAIFDVAVDIRRGSPSFGQWVGVELSADNWTQLLVPKGFAHGFLTLKPDTEVVYKVTDFYNRDSERAIRYDDPDIAIAWPGLASPPVLSEKDAAAPFLRDADVFESPDEA